MTVEYSEDLGIAQLSLSALLSCVVLGTAAFFLYLKHIQGFCKHVLGEQTKLGHSHGPQSAATAWVGSEFLPSSLFSFRKGIFSSGQWEVPMMALKRVSKHLLYLLNENNLFFFFFQKKR